MIDQNTIRRLEALEQRLFQPEVRHSAAELEALLDEAFVEIGASGAIWDRAAIIASLAEEPPVRISLVDFQAFALDDNVVLVTYRALIESPPGAPPAHSLRSSIWICREGAWRMRFHQGTRTSSV
jgi:hypothetical protein